MKSQKQNVLPRETRTLLILINGSKNYGQLVESLNRCKIFTKSGGLKQHFKLLQHLKYIKLRDEIEIDYDEVELTQLETPTKAQIFINKTQSNKEQIAKKSSALFDLEDRREAIILEKDDYSMGSMLISSKAQQLGSLDVIRSKLTGLIEAQTDQQQSQSFLLKLKDCRTSADIYSLIKHINKARNGKISREMIKLAKHLKQSISIQNA